ncbi:MAG: hypothetical protein AB8G86_19820 [Saprospiraceae bacterium]
MTEIAFDIGFKAPAYFSHFFSKAPSKIARKG